MWSPANYARGGAWVRLSQYVRRKTSKALANALPINGTLSAVLDDMQLTANGFLQVATPLSFGTLSAVMDDMVLFSSGQTTHYGSAALALAPMTLAATGKLKLSGAANLTLAPITAAASGNLKISGTLSSTLADITLATQGLTAPTLALQSASGAAPTTFRIGFNSDHYQGMWFRLQISTGSDFSGTLLDDYVDLIYADDIANGTKTLGSGFVQPTGFYRARVRVETNPDDASVNTISAWSSPDVTDTVTATTTTLDPAQKNASLTLSNGNLTATGLNQNAPMLSRTTQQIPVGGKVYAEMHYDSATHIGGMCFGVCNSSQSMTNFTFPGSGNSNGGGFQSNGLYPGGIYYGRDEAVGDTYMLAVYRTDATHAKFWVGNGGSWRSGEDPATNTGGITVTISECYGFAGVKRDEALAANFGASAFTYTPPTGFTKWP
jgi:hypothetical protein